MTEQIRRIRCKQCGDSPSIYNTNKENICVVCGSKRFYRAEIYREEKKHDTTRD